MPLSEFVASFSSTDLPWLLGLGFGALLILCLVAVVMVEEDEGSRTE